MYMYMYPESVPRERSRRANTARSFQNVPSDENERKYIYVSPWVRFERCRRGGHDVMASSWMMTVFIVPVVQRLACAELTARSTRPSPAISDTKPRHSHVRGRVHHLIRTYQGCGFPSSSGNHITHRSKAWPSTSNTSHGTSKSEPMVSRAWILVRLCVAYIMLNRTESLKERTRTVARLNAAYLDLYAVDSITGTSSYRRRRSKDMLVNTSHHQLPRRFVVLEGLPPHASILISVTREAVLVKNKYKRIQRKPPTN